MNALAWLITLPPIQWFAVYAFQTLDSSALGLALEGVFVLVLIIIVQEAIRDYQELFEKEKE